MACSDKCKNQNVILPTGATGAAGAAGASGTAKFAVLTNETSAITANLAGTIQTGSCSTVFRIFSGTTEVNLATYLGTIVLTSGSATVLAALATSLVPGTLGITVTYTWTGTSFTTTTNSEYVDMTLVVSGTTYIKRWNLAKVKNAS